jgi:hypothetical protein
MGLPVVTVASGGLPVVETTSGTPVTEAANLRGVPVTKVVGKPGLPVTFETIGVTTPLGAPLDAVASVTGAWSFSRNMLTSFGAGTRYTKSGTAIISLNDQSGNSRNMTDEGAPAVRPIEVTAFPSSIVCADFDGATQWLGSVALSNFIAAGNGAMVVSVIIDAVTLNNSLPYANHGIVADVSSYMGLFAKNLSGLTILSFNYDGSNDEISKVGAMATPYVLMWRHDGGNLYVSINGGAESLIASGNTQVLTGKVYIGAAGNVSTACNMKLAEAFTTSNGSQTAALAAAIANMKTYCGA